MEQFPPIPSRPLTTGRAPTSTPLMDIQMFRPGPYLAFTLLVLPIVIALIGAGIALDTTGTIPVWLPLVLLLWLPCLPLVWLIMQSARISSLGIAVGRPWRTWEEIPWGLVERVERRGLTIRIISSDGKRLSLTPLLLRDGARLRRLLFLRLPTHVFVGALADETQRLLSGGMALASVGGFAGTLHAQPRRQWYVLLSSIDLLAVAAAIAVVMMLPIAIMIPLIVLCVAVLLISTAMFVWLLQWVELNEEGMTIVWTFPRRMQAVRWAEVEMIEHTPREVLLRVRGKQRIACIGPSLLSTAQRDLMRAFIHEYCTNRSVPIVRRNWFI